jgi:hypothetical protein
MSRRYLSIKEVYGALNRGKIIEAFLGSFENDNKKCIRWITIKKVNNEIVGNIWESYDEGSSEYLDIYSFSPVNGEWDTPSNTISCNNIENLINIFSNFKFNFVNAGVIQDEYASFKTHNKAN